MKTFCIALAGGTVLLVGLALVLLAGPAILAAQFLWARRARRQTKGAVANERRKSGLAA